MPGSTVAELVRVTWEAVPWAIPLVAASTVAAVVVALVLQKTRGAGAWLVAALIVSGALVVALTLTPNAGIEDSSLVDPRFDRGPWGYLRQPEYWLHLDSRTLNVALFVPLGFTLGLLARGAARWAVLAFGLVLPWIVEGLQAVLPFDRDPQSIDLADNSTGFVVGYVAGVLVMGAVAAARGRASTSAGDA